MANAPNPEFRKLWSNQTESLRLGYGGTIQHNDAEAVTEHVRGVFIIISRLVGGTPESVGEV
jgi:hypothetical protein